MGTSCSPLGTTKNYDDRVKLGTYPFSNESWWYCDPACIPKRGDWLLFWIILKKNVSLEDIDNALVKISNEINEKYDSIIHPEASEVTLFPDAKILVAFKSDSTYNLAGLYNNIMSPYLETYKDSVGYMGCNNDYPIIEYSKNPSKPLYSPTESVEVQIFNYGRVDGTVYLHILDKSGVEYRSVHCEKITVQSNNSWKDTLSLEINDPNTESWRILLHGPFTTLTCTDIISNYPSSPNKLIFGEVPQLTTNINIYSSPSGAKVYIDREYKGTTS